MFFNFLNPFHWVRSISGILVIFLLILIPGWTSIFADKTFSKSWEMITSDFFGTVGDATGEAFDYYKSWFESEETQKEIDKQKQKAKDKAKEKIHEEVDEKLK